MIIFPIVHAIMYFQGADSLSDSSVLSIKSIKNDVFTKKVCKVHKIPQYLTAKLILLHYTQEMSSVRYLSQWFEAWLFAEHQMQFEYARSSFRSSLSEHQSQSHRLFFVMAFLPEIFIQIPALGIQHHDPAPCGQSYSREPHRDNTVRDLFSEWCLGNDQEPYRRGSHHEEQTVALSMMLT